MNYKLEIKDLKNFKLLKLLTSSIL